jgi:hypothetical protein
MPGGESFLAIFPPAWPGAADSPLLQPAFGCELLARTTAAAARAPELLRIHACPRDIFSNFFTSRSRFSRDSR